VVFVSAELAQKSGAYHSVVACDEDAFGHGVLFTDCMVPGSFLPKSILTEIGQGMATTGFSGDSPEE
ncbi:MAG: hypothetical protein GY732_21015, partial [Gammaproteobacteria bacterium]|nr:hypothetical protein [Gammaproteobacteria bacterium]